VAVDVAVIEADVLEIEDVVDVVEGAETLPTTQ
jgi:hypothetical protein